jgi:armadillo repeat-containing protein 8
VLITKSYADSEHFVQEQTLALVRNLVDGHVDSTNYVIGEDGMILDAISRQLNNASALGVCIQVAFLYPLFNELLFY